MRYAYTSDFQTFTAPNTYLSLGDASVIDMSILQDGNALKRFYVTGGGTVEQTSTNGLFGNWKTDGAIAGSNGFEAPYAFWDNVDIHRSYLLCDKVGGGAGIHAWTSTDGHADSFAVNNTHNLSFMRHLSVLSVNQRQFDSLSAL